jgi:hypothetical protein
LFLERKFQCCLSLVTALRGNNVPFVFFLLRKCLFAVPGADPTSCTFCNPNKVQGEQWCYNGGTCYYQPLAGVPPPGLPLCGCSYGWSAPSCYSPAPLRRLCDPTNATDLPSASPTSCQFCYFGYPTGQNGCLNFGFCTLSTVANAPPNFQLPICSCSGAQAPPQCLVNVIEVFGIPQYLSYRWAFFAGEVVIGCFAILVLVQHLYYAINYRFTDQNKTKFAGATSIFMCCLMGMLWLGINPSGQVYGYPTAYDVRSNNLLVFFLLFFMCMGWAISTSNWIWIGLAAVATMRTQEGGWPWPAKMVTWVSFVVLLILCTFFSCYAPVAQVNYYGVVFYIGAAWGLVLCLFSVISGIVVIATIKSIDDADPKLLFRTAVQLALLSAFECIGCVLLIIVISLPASIYTSANMYITKNGFCFFL